jgi:hypothetical protein
MPVVPRDCLSRPSYTSCRDREPAAAPLAARAGRGRRRAGPRQRGHSAAGTGGGRGRQAARAVLASSGGGGVARRGVAAAGLSVCP